MNNQSYHPSTHTHKYHNHQNHHSNNNYNQSSSHNSYHPVTQIPVILTTNHIHTTTTTTNTNKKRGHAASSPASPTTTTKTTTTNAQNSNDNNSNSNSNSGPLFPERQRANVTGIGINNRAYQSKPLPIHPNQTNNKRQQPTHHPQPQRIRMDDDWDDLQNDDFVTKSLPVTPVRGGGGGGGGSSGGGGGGGKTTQHNHKMHAGFQNKHNTAIINKRLSGALNYHSNTHYKKKLHLNSHNNHKKTNSHSNNENKHNNNNNNNSQRKSQGSQSSLGLNPYMALSEKRTNHIIREEPLNPADALQLETPQTSLKKNNHKNLKYNNNNNNNNDSKDDNNNILTMKGIKRSTSTPMTNESQSPKNVQNIQNMQNNNNNINENNSKQSRPGSPKTQGNRPPIPSNKPPSPHKVNRNHNNIDS